MATYVPDLLHLPLLALLVWVLIRKRTSAEDGLSHFFALRFFKIVALVALFSLAGCASHEKLAVASGPAFALNPDHWQATAADLSVPDAER